MSTRQPRTAFSTETIGHRLRYKWTYDTQYNKRTEETLRARVMTRQELQEQILQLPISERWQIVQSVLSSLQQETLPSVPDKASDSSFIQSLDPWTQSLVGIASSDSSYISAESYIDYLEQKYS